MNTVCIFSHDYPKLSSAQRSVQLTDDHKVVNHRRSVSSIPRSLAVGPTALYNMTVYSAVLADTEIRLIVKITAQRVRKQSKIVFLYAVGPFKLIKNVRVTIFK